MCDNHDHIHIVTLALLSLLLAHCPRHLASNIFWHIECGEQERSDGCDTRERARACVTRAISRALALDANKKKLQRPALVPIGTLGGVLRRAPSQHRRRRRHLRTPSVALAPRFRARSVAESIRRSKSARFARAAATANQRPQRGRGSLWPLVPRRRTGSCE